MVTGQHQALHSAQRNPAGRFHGLGRFVNYPQVKRAILQNAGVQTCQCGAQHFRGVQQMIDDLLFHASGVGNHLTGFRAHLAALARRRLRAWKRAARSCN